MMEAYTETRRDQVEKELSLAANRRELDARYSHPYQIYAYWLVREQVCLIYIEDTSRNISVEYTVPGEEVSQHFDHALAHPDANFPQPWDGE